MSPRFVFVSLLVSLAACGGTDGLPCSGTCGTMSVSVKLTDVDAAAVTCGDAGVARVELAIAKAGGGAIVGKRTIDCDPGTITLGPIDLGSYDITATALDKHGGKLGANTRSGALAKMGDHADVSISIVPSAASLLGTDCNSDGTCAAGYDCAHVMFGSASVAFCTQSCGTSPKSTKPANGALACEKGYSGVGYPTCSLYGMGDDPVVWSCVIACGLANACPTGLTCTEGACVHAP